MSVPFLRAFCLATLMAGGVNWGLAGLSGVDMVAVLLGEDSLMARQAYILVGLAAVVLCFPLHRWSRAPETDAGDASGQENR